MLQWKLQTNTSQSESIVSLFDLSYQSGSRTLKAPRVIGTRVNVRNHYIFCVGCPRPSPRSPTLFGPSTI